MADQENTSRPERTAARNDVYVSLAPGQFVEAVVLVGTKHLDLSERQLRLLFECLREVLEVES